MKGKPMEKLEMIKDSIAGGEQIANICGITSRRVRQLAGEGHLTKLEHGKYPYPQAVREYCEYLRNDVGQELRNRELELKCRLKEQQLRDNRNAMRNEIEQQDWEEMQDIWAEYRSELAKLELDEKCLDKLNETLDKVRRHVDKKQMARISDGQSQNGSD